MIEIFRITLNNEMDLMLAHRRSMKLAELSGLSLSLQTTFATAVSEVLRSAIENRKVSRLVLSIDTSKSVEKFVVAAISNNDPKLAQSEGFEQAKKLVNKFDVSKVENETTVSLHFFIPASHKLYVPQIEQWKTMFKAEKPLSPYEEIKVKNEQLQQLASKLQESQDQYKTLTNSLPLIIFSLDQNGEMIYSNDWLHQYTGFSSEQLNASKWKAVVHPDDYHSFRVLLNECQTSAALTIKLECRLRQRATDQYLWHLISLAPLKVANGSTSSWIGFMADINTQKLLEATLKNNEELQITQAQLREHEASLQQLIIELNRSNRELKDFAYVASHDLQEPIRKITFYGDYLLTQYKDQLDEKGVTYLTNLVKASKRMRTLVRDLLVYSEIHPDAFFTPVDLNELMQEITSDFDLVIKEKNAFVEASILPVIEGNASMLRQLFGNIVANAIKYSNPKVRLHLKISHRLVDNGVVISFEDNGIGFDDIYVDKIFTLFQRLHTREQYEGTGLGLAICRKIVEVHKGTISAKSQVGKGASFITTLPLEQSKLPEVAN